MQRLQEVVRDCDSDALTYIHAPRSDSSPGSTGSSDCAQSETVSV
ncbi:MAG TPA: hypothetical protein VF326_06335 [Anaerolineaceae bacterium]